MNSFTLEILEGGVWKNPTAVFPFTVGELLDERLDEGNVVFYSTTPEYKPLTEVRISFFKDGAPDYDARGSNVEYFITANDNAVEYPSGSGRYKHEIYLIERMKLTEGILCPSLTFTNSLPFTVQTVGNRVEAQITVNLPDFAPIPDFKGYGGFFSPIKSGYTFVAPSVYEQQKSFLSSPIPSGSLTFIPENSGYTVRINGAVIQSGTVSYDGERWQNLNKAIAIDGSVLTGGTLEVIYTIQATYNSGVSANYTYTVSYTMSVTDVIALRPYSITDCVCRVLEEAEPLEFRSLPRFEFDGVIRSIATGDITGYALGSQAEKYSKIKAPEFTLTQSTLREQLRAIGGFIHAEPYIDEDNTVYFLEYGNTAVDGIEGTPYISHTRKWDINQYCTEIRSNAQNLTSSLGFAKGAKIEPLNNAYRSLRLESGYNRINEQDGVFDTDEPIYEINSVKVGLLAGSSVASGWATIGAIALRDLDITPYIVEQTVYDSNLYPTGFWPFSRTYALYYTMGGKGIKGLFYQPEVSFNQGAQPFAIANIIATVAGVDSQRVHNLMTAVFGDTPPSNLVFNITYKPISSALVSHGKQTYTEGEARYTLIYNQSDNLVETEYYGEHLKGVAARLGNVEVERTFLLSSRRAIPKIGYTIDGYSISAVACEYMPKYIKCTVGLTKDYNRISEYVGINSVKRMYEISERQSQDRSILINRTCLITENPYESSEPDRIFEVSGFINAINEYRYEEGNAGLYEDEIVNSALVTTKKKQTLEEIATVLLPVTARSFGNSVHFSFGMKDNYSAGSRTEWVEEADISGRWQKDVPYSDLYGRAWWLSFGLVTRAYTPINTAFSLPATDEVSVSETTLDNIGEDVSTVAYTHRLRKDSRECIRYNVEVDYKTDVDGLIIGSGLAARCRYLNNYDIDRPHIYITSRDISKLGRTFDYDPMTDRRADTSGEIRWYNRGDHIELNFSGLIGERFKYWVICSPISTVTERYVDEGGSVVEETVVKGGEVILAGKIPELNGLTVKNLYFVIK